MKRALFRSLTAATLSVALLGGHVTYACTMPDQLIMARTMLNISHPDATFVLGATWTLQKEGRLDMPDPELVVARGAERAALEEKERLATVQAVYDFKNALNASNPRGHAVSIVVVNRMHRERLLPVRPPALGETSAAPEDEILIVTTEPALHAIMAGELSIEQALSFGVVRIYGETDRHTAFTADFGHIGYQPLPSSPMPTYLASGGSSAWSDLVKRTALISKNNASEGNPSEQ